MTLRISSKQIVQDLSKYGITAKKTFSSLEMPNLGILNKHLIRGYFDGDGCIGIYKQRENGTRYRITLSNGGKSLIKSIGHLIPSCIKFYIEERSNCNCWNLNIFRKQSVKDFGDWMYNCSNYYLPRKKDKFDLILGNTEITNEIKELLVS